MIKPARHKNQSIPAVEGIASAVFDNGRRGSPRPGCDCVQCFGYCNIDRDKLQRDASERATELRLAEAPNEGRYRALRFDD